MDYAPSLVVVEGDNLVGKQLADLFPEKLEVAIQVVAELFLKGCELCRCVSRVALKVGNLF